MTDDEITQARERAMVVVSGLDGKCSQAAAHRQLAADVVALADALRFTYLLLDEEIASEV